ncbi:MAG: hypothetical protein IPG09_18200 [Ignavibacteria bacterium]|nr:hypothetical protein [Ignavibacteria bacterium]
MTFDPGMTGQNLLKLLLKKYLNFLKLKKLMDMLFDLEVDGSCNEKFSQNV